MKKVAYLVLLLALNSVFADEVCTAIHYIRYENQFFYIDCTNNQDRIEIGNAISINKLKKALELGYQVKESNYIGRSAKYHRIVYLLIKS